jgi:Zn-dependent peptidase ImmA (M78 family)/transcriptional regulator with XRE-family HTH domain
MRKPFNPDMLALARDARGLTQTELVAALKDEMSQAKLSKIENGLVAPSEEDVAALARALRVRQGFFFHPHMRRAEPATYHRKRKKLAKKDWAKIYARAEIYRINTGLFLKSIELAPSAAAPPSIDPDQYDGRVEEIALAIRQLWSLPRGPVEDVTALLERAGVVVVSYDFGNDLCDGFTQHPSEGMPPVVFVNTRQPKDKLRFTLAHELGHLVMHRLPNPNMEEEANRFAAEFLMPSADILKDFYNLSMDKFMALKLYWRTSMQSLIMKAHRLGRMSDSAFKYYMINMSKRGWRTREPVELTNVREAPRLVMQLVNGHIDHLDYTIEDMSRLIGLEPSEVEDLYGLALRPRLRIVS